MTISLNSFFVFPRFIGIFVKTVLKCKLTAYHSNGGLVQFCHQCLLSHFCVNLSTILLMCLLIVQEVYVKQPYLQTWHEYATVFSVVLNAHTKKTFHNTCLGKESHSVPLYVDKAHTYPRYCLSWTGSFHPRSSKRREESPPQTKPWAFMPQDKYRHSIGEASLPYIRGVLRKFCLHLFDRWNINVHTSAGASRWHFSTLRTQWNLNIASTERGPRREIIGVLWIVPNWIVFY